MTTTQKDSKPRIREYYQTTVISELLQKHQLKNPMQAPRLKKIVVNMGLSEARDNVKVVDTAAAELAAITGQKPQVRRAKKSISSFKLRAGMPIGLRVTLRGDRMYEFFDRLVSAAVPRIRDFHGLEPNGFDGRGHYNLGLNEQYIFPEIDAEKSDKARGMNISFVTSAGRDELALDLLKLLGMPFKETKNAERRTKN